MSYSWLPALLAEIAEVAGLEAALKLAESHGGTRMSIPARITSDEHELVQCVGREAADKICALYRQGTGSGRSCGINVLIPRGPTGAIADARRRLAKALAGGASAAEAARAAGMTERSAYRARARGRAEQDDKQGRLF
ncbi:hypothetical protein CCR97_04195 [Rhodoplanes elegans]|uniref:Mor transcription activator domain-containing protein n=1 Tax=Rhodoplanes elegans TaxID=29408 RepID=A0A327KPI0_9BRAD|nr:hypothetical protein [Rhodoplanes elegans]MBK5957410.1 hypothetical protein [Rhodoplanes elegans]RAI39533.1 hypothetical protein CH338_09170 [Rhodoplanes elegans]